MLILVCTMELIRLYTSPYIINNSNKNIYTNIHGIHKIPKIQTHFNSDSEENSRTLHNKHIKTKTYKIFTKKPLLALKLPSQVATFRTLVVVGRTIIHENVYLRTVKKVLKGTERFLLFERIQHI